MLPITSKHKKIQNDKDVVHIYFSTDIARDGITDAQVLVTTTNKNTEATTNSNHVFSITGTKENKAWPTEKKDEQSEQNIKKAHEFFQKTYDDYINRGYIETPTLYDKLQSSVENLREQFFSKIDKDKPEIK